jgi:hypothetical protein
MTFRIRNKTPFTLNGWWVDGTRGNKIRDILPDEEITMDSYISHTFFYRADFVTGRTLTNEVG